MEQVCTATCQGTSTWRTKGPCVRQRILSEEGATPPCPERNLFIVRLQRERNTCGAVHSSQTWNGIWAREESVPEESFILKELMRSSAKDNESISRKRNQIANLYPIFVLLYINVEWIMNEKIPPLITHVSNWTVSKVNNEISLQLFLVFMIFPGRERIFFNTLLETLSLWCSEVIC